jgi:hypothetical protein
LETELLFELVDTELLRMPFPLQDTTGDETAGHMMQLGPLRAGLTAREGQLIFADADDFFNLRADAIEAADLCSR